MIRYFTGHPTGANVLMLAVVLMGLSVLPQLQRDTFPVIPTTEVEIRVAYPGANSAEVAEDVCQPIEDAVDSISGLFELRCDARDNIAITTAQMSEGEDIDLFANDIQQQVTSINSFPAKVERPTVTKLDRTAVVASIAITGDMAPADLYAYAKQVKQRFKANPAIAQVRLNGFSEQDIDITATTEVLNRYGLSIADLANMVEQQSMSLPAGQLTDSLQQQTIRFDDKRRTEAAFHSLIVGSSEAGAQIALGDIAQIEQVFAQEEDKILFNGQRAALLEISKTYQQDSLRVREVIQRQLEKERTLAPQGIQLTVSQDVTTNIRERLRILSSNGLQGLALVFLVMWGFFNFRFSLWVAMGLPVSFLGAVFAMYWLGYTINMMTMVGLLVAIGLLMDDSLIIAENIAAQRQAGKSPLDAAVEGTKQVLPGVLSSFATTILVVGPLMFLTGKMGAVLRFLPVILLITLAVSLIEAFLILPAHLSHCPQAEQPQSGIKHWIQHGFEGLRDNIFVPLAAKAMTMPYLTMGVLLMAVLISSATIPAGWLKFRAFPELESDVIQARILLPQGSLLSQTETVVKQVSQALTALAQEYQSLYPDSEPLVNNISILYNTNVDAFESGPHLATVSADLLPAQFRQANVKTLIQQWKKKVGPVADVISLKFTDKERGVAGKGIDIRIQGNSLEELKAVSWKLQSWLKSFDGVYNLSDDLRYGKPEISIQMKNEAGALGIKASQVALTLRSAISGNTAMSVQQQGDSIDVIVRLDLEGDGGIQALQDLQIPAANDILVPLSAVAEFSQSQGFSRIQRVNTINTVTVQGNINNRIVNTREIMQLFKSEFVPQIKQQYPEVMFASQGQDKESAETGSSLATNLMFGLLGVYLILIFQFHSYLQPLAILLAIPMGWVGVIWGHLALGLDLTMPSLVGFATLAGIVVNDNILLVSFIKNYHRQGQPLEVACKQAVQDRFRAIMLTSLTTIAGVLPLLTETSTQAQFLIPIIASLAFGLMATTLLASIVVPCMLLILDDLNVPITKKTAPEPAPLAQSA